MADPNPFDSDSSQAESSAGEDAVDVNIGNPGGDASGHVFGSPSELPEDLRQQYDRLKAEEEELDRREALFDEREQILWDREKSVMDKRPANWPPCKPIVRHDIKEDIPETWQRLVTAHYIEWIVFAVLVVYNTVALVFDFEKRIGDFFISFIFIFILMPFHFLVYRFMLYQSVFKKKSAIMFAWFIFRGLEILTYGYFALGFPGSGAAGYWNMGEAFNTSDLAGIMMLVSAVCFTLLFIVSIVGFIMVRRRYSEMGGLSKAKEEAYKAGVQAAKDNPDLVAKGAKAGAKAAADNPELAMKGAKAAAKA